MTGAIQHFQLFFYLGVRVVVEFVAGRLDLRSEVTFTERLKFAAGDAFEKMNLAGATIEHTFKLRAIAKWPDNRRRLQTEDIFEFIEQRDRVYCSRPVALVHEREYGHCQQRRTDFRKVHDEFAFQHLFGRVDAPLVPHASTAVSAHDRYPSEKSLCPGVSSKFTAQPA